MNLEFNKESSKSIKNEMDSSYEKNEFKLLKSMFETIPIPMIIVDKNMKIFALNKAYTHYLKVEEKQYIGSDIRKFISNTRIPTVMKTKISELSNYHYYTDGPAKGQEAIVHRIPIIVDNDVIGCFGMVMFQNIEELMQLTIRNKYLKDELEYYKKELKSYNNSKYTIDNIIGHSKTIVEMKNKINKYSSTKSTILIVGESGTGKELVAHSIHNCSQRSSRPFVKLNCAAIPESLAETEFFGYEGGAYTGANKKGNIGYFERANGGTLFLDEIGELSLLIQSKLLRVLQEKEVMRVGGHKIIPIDVRIITATNKNLEKMVKDGTFREDLFFRLNILSIKVPTLGERIADVRELSLFFLDKFYKEYGILKLVSEEVFEVLEKYPWNGNIRELSNVLEKMYFISETTTIGLNDLPINIQRNVEGRFKFLQDSSLDKMIENLEKETVKTIMKNTGNNKSETLKTLKISRPTKFLQDSSLDKMIEDLEKETVKTIMKNTGNNKSETSKTLKISRPRLYRILSKI